MSRHALHHVLLITLLAAPLAACQDAAAPAAAPAVAAEAAVAEASAAPAPVPAPAPGDAVLAGPKGSGSIDWYHGTVDAAFAAAKAQGKPVFMYWGAEWCPYCAQLEAEVFTDARFLERTRQFVALYVDGDDAGLTPLFEKYQVTGFPTTIVLAPDGTELGRLPAGNLKAVPYLESLDALLKAGRPLDQILQDALAGTPLGAAEWIALSQSRQLLQPTAGEARAKLAEACPPEHAEAARRFKLLALLGSPDSVAALWPKYGAELQRVLADAALAREQQLLLIEPQGPLSAVPEEEREPLRTQWEAALFTLAADPQVSARTRMMALNEAVELAQQATPTLPAEKSDRARALVAEVDRGAREPLERQAAIGVAASVLAKLGDQAAAEAMVEADLPHSRSPYHSMTRLADWAAQRGDTASELSWARRSYENALTSDKPRVRLRSTGEYLQRLVQKAPQERDEVVRVAGKLLELAAAGGADFNPKRMDWMQRQLGPLVAWSSQQRDAAALTELQPRLDALCRAVHERSREACARLLSTGGSGPAS
jgi:thiol-disulfide isomerase/thioredoxin